MYPHLADLWSLDRPLGCMNAAEEGANVLMNAVMDRIRIGQYFRTLDDQHW